MSVIRTVVTGTGHVCPLGETREALWSDLMACKSGVKPLTGDFTGLPVSYGAFCADFTGRAEDFWIEDKEVKRNVRKAIKIMARETQMSVASAQRALNDAGLSVGSWPLERTGVFTGTDYMVTDPPNVEGAFRACLDADQNIEMKKWGVESLRAMNPLWLLIALPNMPGCHVSIANQMCAGNNSIIMREAAANLAALYASRTIMRDQADVMLAGATGTRLHQMRTLQIVINEPVSDEHCIPEEASRPFEMARTGQVLGEGAGTIILERMEYAKARNANILAEILGGSSSCVGTHTPDLARKHLVPNRKQALENVLIGALRDTGLTPDDVGFIHAHGLGTLDSDREEAAAINTVFASRKTPVPIVAAKANWGNLGAGSGMLEVISGIESLRMGRLFPVLNYQVADPQCPLNVVTSTDIPAGDVFINLSVTPYGQASALVVGKYQG